ncbi:MAG TPA: SRPBCC domain-containing protein [Drouetiella sp.]
MTNATSRTDFLPIIEKTFDFPVEKVFDAFINKEKLAKWWGPHEFTNPKCEVDARPGGIYKIVMRGPDGVEFPCVGEFKTIDPPRKLIYTIDVNEHPPEWHQAVNQARGVNTKMEEMIFEILFDDLNGKTKVSVKASFGDKRDYEALLKIGMKGGWGQSFEKLEALL